MSTIYVFGHKNPDNDAIMAPIVLSQLMNAVDPDNAYEPKRLGPLPAETKKVLSECGIPEPELLESISAVGEDEEAQKVFLVDHNEEAQSVEGLYNGEIVGVVDHHRVGDLHTTNPVEVVVLPWGSSCSIVYYLFHIYGVDPTKEQLTCILSAMMTDMVMLKSPTTTNYDRGFVAQISEMINLDPIEFGMELFNARPAATPAEMVGNDIKEFDVGGKRIFIGQYETVNKDAVLEQLDGIRAAMETYKQEQGADGVVLCVTDIMEEGSQVLMCGETGVAEKGLGITNEPEGVWMPGVLSRKKQVAAPILAAAEE